MPPELSDQFDDFPRRPFPGESFLRSQRMERQSPQWQIEALSRGQWYPLGLPPRQTDVEQPFFKTQDVLFLMEALGARRAQGEPVYAVVANPKVNIERGLAHQYPELSSAQRTEMAEERRWLIGLKDKFFYEAVQFLLAEEAAARGESFAMVPVFMMSNFESEPGFSVLQRDVFALFDFSKNPDFVEKVYGCVPKGGLPHRHRGKTYGELVALGNSSFLNEMNALAEYVLYQIAMVLFLGGTKLGHAGEAPYNEATAYARDLLGVHPFIKPVHFSEVDLSGATGISPYRAKIGMERAKEADSFTSYRSFADYQNAYLSHIDDLWARIREFGLIQHKTQMKALATLFSGEKDYAQVQRDSELEMQELARDFVLSMVQGLQEISKAEDESINPDRMIRFRHLLYRQIELSDLSFEEKRLILESFLLQDSLESILTLDQPPHYLESFLLRSTELSSVLEGKLSLEEWPSMASEWLPFDVFPKPIDMHQSEFLLRVGSVLIPLKDKKLGFDEKNAHLARWAVSREAFERAIFNKELLRSISVETLQTCSGYDEMLELIFASHFNLFEKIKWEALGQFFDCIKGTPLQKVYQCWLAGLQGDKNVDQSGVGPLDESLRVRVKALLGSFAFNEHFRSVFSQFI